MPPGPSVSAPSEFETLTDYLEAVEKHYRACLDHVEHKFAVDEINATLRFHYLKFDGDGIPKFKTLANVLVEHIIYYCIACRQRPGELRAHEYARLYKQARDLFRKEDTSGEAGELLLYFLLETVIKAPQAVCKMSLKTNRREEVKGSDGIHVAYDQEDDCLILYLGESKLYKAYGDALKDALDSIQTLYDEQRSDYELELVTSHFKHLDETLKNRISEYLDSRNPDGKFRICHACLIGFEWAKYSALGTDKHKTLISTFRDDYLKQCKKLAVKASELFEGYSCRHLSFEFFFIPFQSVGDFRAAFKRALFAGEE